MEQADKLALLTGLNPKEIIRMSKRIYARPASNKYQMVGIGWVVGHWTTLDDDYKQNHPRHGAFTPGHDYHYELGKQLKKFRKQYPDEEYKTLMKKAHAATKRALK